MSPGNIDSLTVAITPAVSSTGSGKVTIVAALCAKSPRSYTCSTDMTRSSVTCVTIRPQLTVLCSLG